MADEVVDTIKVALSADATGVTEGVDKAEEELQRLKKFVTNPQNDPFASLSSDGVGKFRDIADAMRSLAGSAQSLGGVSKNITEIGAAIKGLGSDMGGGDSSRFAQFGQAAEALKAFNEIDAQKVTAASAALSGLQKSLSGLSGANVDTNSLQGTLDGIARASARAAEVGPGIDKLGSGIRNIKKGLDEFSTGGDYMASASNIQRAIGAVFNAVRETESGGDLSKTATAMQNMGSGIRALAQSMGAFMETDFGGSEMGENTGAVKNFENTINGLNSAVSNVSGIDKSGESIKALGNGIRQIHNGLMLFSKDDYTANIDNFGSVIRRLGSSLVKAQGLSNAGNLNKTASGLNALTKALSNFGGSDYSTNVVAASNSIDVLAKSVGKLGSVGDSVKSVNKTASGLNALRKALSGFWTTVSPSAVDASASAITSIGNAARSVGDVTEEAKGIQTLGRAIQTLGMATDMYQSFDIGDIKNAASGVAKTYQQTISKLAPLTSGKGVFGSAFAESAKKATSAIGSLGRGMESLHKGVSGLATDGDNLGKAADNISAFVGKLDKAIGSEQADKVYKLGVGLQSLTRYLNEYNNAAQNATRSNPQFKAAEVALQALGKALQWVSNKLESMAKRGFSALNAGAKRYLSLMGKVVTLPLDGMRSKLDSVRHSLDGVAGMVGRIVAYRALRGVLSAIVDGFNAGLQNLYQWALVSGNAFANTMDSMASSMQYFQNSVGAAASELLDALAPALETIVNWVVTVLNALNQLFAALTGHGTWRKAVRQQTAFAAATGGAADGADKAKEAVKEYERTVLGFDELNKMNKPDTSGSNSGSGGGGGGASAPDYGGMFEEVPLDDFYKNLANTDDWTALGKKIADSLNSWESQIDWDSIDKTAAMWSKRIWTAFNGFVSERDWSLFGYTIARGLNVGLHFIDDIAQNADFTAFGAGIAGALNRAVETIDWVALGHVMTDKLKVSLEILHGFMNGDSTYAAFDFERLRGRLNVAIGAAFGNIDWNTAVTDITNGMGQLALTFVSGVNEVIVNLDAVVQGYDWTQWGRNVGYYLNKSVQEIDWPAVGRFLTDGLKMALDGLHGALQAFNWTALSSGIRDAMAAAFDNIDWGQAGEDINNLANHLLQLVKDAIGNIDWDDVKAFINGLNIPQLLWESLVTIAQGLGELFVNAMETNLWPLILAWIVGKVALAGIRIAIEIAKWNFVGQAIAAGMTGGEGVAGGLFGGFAGAGLGSTIGAWISQHIGAGGTVTAAGSAGSAIGLGLVGALGVAANLSGFKDQLENGLTPANFAETIAGGAATGAAIGGAFGGPVGAGIGAAVGAVAGGVETIVANWGSISDWLTNTAGPAIQGAFDAIGQWLSDWASGAAEALQPFLDGLQGAVDWIGDHIPQPVKDAFSGIADFFTDTFSPVPAEAEEYGSDTGEGLSDGMDGKQQDVSDSATSLADLIQQGIDGATSQASEWGNDISDYLSGGISAFAGNVYGAASGVASDIQSGVGAAVDAAGSWGSDVSQFVGSGINGAVGWVSSAAGAVYDSISGILGSIGSTAMSWGMDIANSVANGIWRGISSVGEAASNLATTIWNYIHFSEPEVGPLADFHTYMPDMMRGLAHGIDRNSYLVTDSVENLTRGMSLGLSASVSYDYPSAEDVLSSAVERGMVSVVLGQQGGSDRGTTVVLRVDSEDLAKAVLRGNDRLAQRNPLAFA
ncbi:MAG: hypothetical protein PUF11_09405 [Parafannyhessea umbonata]|uniref:hypothetical protein n=1 Tax=Parafannyhessea umbonata TaxID=604330 RepID=UPI0026EDF526|nr:hypothetical protein [Parafannyhessea umbonata]MDD6566981.1 hypothetical protein [Parafannyhessea umbonata]